ncbi:hypothetical protein, partial [Gracilinema caldarium]|uniref:hypothetical protein n=1 Tax=Gracilinema caldarium TaxID=215591 RepID=UPI0026F0F57F
KVLIDDSPHWKFQLSNIYGFINILIYQNNDFIFAGQDKVDKSPKGPATPARAANLFAKVCPSCGAGPSVYRTECFNCGKAL